MIRFITKQRLASLVGRRDRAEARVPAVQRRLARIKGERDQLAADLAQARAELAVGRQVEDWFKEAIDHLGKLAEAPVEVIVRNGVAYGVRRSRESAKADVQRIDPSVPGWCAPTPGQDLARSGWVLTTLRLPQLTYDDCPPDWGKVLAHFALREQPATKAAPAAEQIRNALPGGEAVAS